MAQPVSHGNQPLPDLPQGYSNPIIQLFRAYIQPLQEQLKQFYERQLKPLKERIQKLEILNRKLQTEMEGAERNLQEVRFEAARKLEALKSQIQGLEERLSAETIKNGLQGSQIAELQNLLSQLKSDYESLNDRFIRQGATLQEANLHIQDLDSRLQSMASRVVEVEERLRAEQAGRLADTLQARQSRLNELRAQSAEEREKLTAASRGFALSIMPIAAAYMVGGPAAWGIGVIMAGTTYYNAWTKGETNSETTQAREEEIARLTKELEH